MATVASQIILHPTTTQTVKLLGTTIGRDKLYRGIQYFARFYAWFLVSRGYSVDSERWTALKNHLGLGRKLMRLGKPIEHLQSALKAAQLLNRPGEGITTIGRQLAYAAYLIFDGLSWASTIRFISVTPDTAKKYANRAFRFWFIGILFSLVNGFLKAGRLAHEAKRLRLSTGEKGLGDEAERVTRFTGIERERAATRFQFVLDLLDVWIPAAGLGYIQLNDGVLGIFGMITSFLALQKQWEAAAK